MQRITRLRRLIQSLQDQPEKAVPYLQEAARLGDYESIRTLVHCYSVGDAGLDPDPQQAYEYTVLGAKLGEGWCQYNAAICCRDGIGCPPDPDQAARWMRLAAEADVPEAWLPAAQMLIDRDQAYDEALRLIRKAVDAGQKEAGIRLLGHLFSEKGARLSAAGDHEGAVQVLEAGAGLPDADCLVALAYEYSLAVGIGQDMEKTYACSLKAADLGHPAGMYNVSMCCREGAGTSQDARKAFEWMKNAAKSGFEEAWLPLAQHYHAGLGVRKNDDQARFWLEKARPVETDPERVDMLERLERALQVPAPCKTDALTDKQA